jgi:hypothetical protein
MRTYQKKGDMNIRNKKKPNEGSRRKEDNSNDVQVDTQSCARNVCHAKKGGKRKRQDVQNKRKVTRNSSPAKKSNGSVSPSQLSFEDNRQPGFNLGKSSKGEQVTESESNDETETTDKTKSILNDDSKWSQAPFGGTVGSFFSNKKNRFQEIMPVLIYEEMEKELPACKRPKLGIIPRERKLKMEVGDIIAQKPSAKSPNKGLKESGIKILDFDHNKIILFESNEIADRCLDPEHFDELRHFGTSQKKPNILKKFDDFEVTRNPLASKKMLEDALKKEKELVEKYNELQKNIFPDSKRNKMVLNPTDTVMLKPEDIEGESDDFPPRLLSQLQPKTFWKERFQLPRIRCRVIDGDYMTKGLPKEGATEKFLTDEMMVVDGNTKKLKNFFIVLPCMFCEKKIYIEATKEMKDYLVETKLHFDWSAFDIYQEPHLPQAKKSAMAKNPHKLDISFDTKCGHCFWSRKYTYNSKRGECFIMKNFVQSMLSSVKDNCPVPFKVCCALVYRRETHPFYYYIGNLLGCGKEMTTRNYRNSAFFKNLKGTQKDVFITIVDRNICRWFDALEGYVLNFNYFEYWIQLKEEQKKFHPWLEGEELNMQTTARFWNDINLFFYNGLIAKERHPIVLGLDEQADDVITEEMLSHLSSSK